MPVGFRRELVRAVAADRYAALASNHHRYRCTWRNGVRRAVDGDAGDAQTIAVGIRVIVQQLAADRRVFRRGDHLRLEHRRRVGDIDGNNRRLGHASAADRVGIAVFPHVTRLRRVGNRTVRIDGDRAMCRAIACLDRHHRRLAFEAVIGQCRGGDWLAGVGGGGIRRDINHRRHVQGQSRADAAIAVAIADRVVDHWHGAMPVGFRRELVHAVAADRYAALASNHHRYRCTRGNGVRRAVDGDAGDGQTIAVGIRVIVQQLAADRRVFRRGDHLRLEHRRRVGDVDGHQRRLCHATAADRVGVAVFPHVTRLRRVGNRTVRIDGDRAMCRAIARLDRHHRRLAFEAVIGQYRRGHWLAGVGGGGIRRDIDHRRHVNDHRCRGRIAIAIGNDIGEAVRAKPVGRRDIVESAIGAQRDAAAAGRGQNRVAGSIKLAACQGPGIAIGRRQILAIAMIELQVSGQWLVFGRRKLIVPGGGHIVNDGHYHRVAHCIAMLVDAGVGKAVGLRHAAHVSCRAGQYIAELAIGAHAPVAQRRTAALRDAYAPAIGEHQVARGGMAHAGIGACQQAAFIDRSAGGAGRHAGNVGHIDCQGGGRGVAIGVGDRIAEDILHIGRGGVRTGDIAVAAIGLERQGAVLPGDGCANAGRHRRTAACNHAGHATARLPAIGAGLVVGQHATGGVYRQSRAFSHAVVVGRGGRHIVNNGHYHRIAYRIAMLVHAGVAEAVGFRHAGHVGGRVGQHIAELAIGADAPVAERGAAALPATHAPAIFQH